MDEATKIIQICGHYTESKSPNIHLKPIAQSTMDQTILNRPGDGNSKLLYPQTALITEIQQNLKWMHVQYVREMVYLSQPSPVQATSSISTKLWHTVLKRRHSLWIST
jgi:hypothetical protein